MFLRNSALLFDCWMKPATAMKGDAAQQSSENGTDSFRSKGEHTSDNDDSDIPIDAVHMQLGKNVSLLLRKEMRGVIRVLRSDLQLENEQLEELREIIRSQEDKIVCLERINSDLKRMLQETETVRVNHNQPLQSNDNLVDIELVATNGNALSRASAKDNL